MQIISFHPENFIAIQEHIQKQLPVILPTDTSYGFSGDIFSPNAVSLVERIKGRENKPFLILTPNNDTMMQYGEIKNIQKIEELQQKGVPISFLLPKTKMVPHSYFPNFSEIAIRVPSSFLPLQSFLHFLNMPIFSTSANFSAEAPIYDEAIIIKTFSHFPEILFASAGNLPYRPVSSLVRILDDGIEVLR